ncbi:polyubiquitin-B-like [Hemitrygon akajei]|uniref:polyubiquitin-B-like n=1 Tax=Hemitrygon akajei TaxID=2704970 RepID=UPI003BFA39D5
MRLQVKFITGEGIELDVDPSIQVSTLKMKIQQKTNVPISQQRLMVQNGQSVEMQDNRSLSYYNLNPSPTVMLLVRKEESMQIFLQNDQGKTRTYDVQPSETVQSFKEQVHRQEGVRPEQQRLVYNSKQLEDGRLLSDYNIRPRTTIFLTLRLRGGMRLQVKFITGEGIELDVDPSIQVSTLKMKIQQKTNVPISQQRLMVQNGQSVEMQDNRSLSYYNLNPSPTVMLLVRKEESMQIFLQNDKGKTTTYDVLPSETVQSFKEQVHRQEGVRPEQQRLVYNSKQLEDGRLLSDYNIRPRTTIFLTLRLRGG